MAGPRVLIVLTSSQRRGAEVEGSQLAAELQRLGTPTTVVALAHAATGEAAARLDVRVLGDQPLSLGTLRALRREARSHDIVVAFGSTTLPACSIALLGARTPFVYRSIGDPSRWLRGRLHRLRTGWLFRRAAHVVALWPAAGETIAELHGVRTAAISCIPNARHAPAALEASDVARAQLGLPVGAPVVAWVGALSAEKRPLLAVESLAAMPGAWLLLAGEGPLSGEVAAAAQRLLPGRHVVLGTVDDLAPVWAAADVVLLTSATEGMPGVLLEAALHGVPAVATRVGAVSEVVADGDSGRVVPVAAQPDEIAAAFAEVVAHAEAWGAAGKAVAAKRFTWSVVAPQWAALLAEVGSRAR